MADQVTPGAQRISSSNRPEALVDVLDSLLDTGVVADAQLVISVAGVDLVFVGLRALLASMDTAGRMMVAPPRSETVSQLRSETVNQPRAETVDQPRAETVNQPRGETVAPLPTETAPARIAP